jgi:hypothetical protein
MLLARWRWYRRGLQVISWITFMVLEMWPAEDAC